MLDQAEHTEVMLFGEQGSINISFTQNNRVSPQKCDKSKEHEKYYREGQWDQQEQFVYLAFLKEHKSFMFSSSYMKKHRIFKKISILLGTRTPIQVKSHHQKLADKHKKISKIIAALEKRFKVNKKEKQHENLAKNHGAQIQLQDASIQTESSSMSKTFFIETNALEKYIYTVFDLDKDSLFA